jgi:hypothetical protein
MALHIVMIPRSLAESGIGPDCTDGSKRLSRFTAKARY